MDIAYVITATELVDTVWRDYPHDELPEPTDTGFWVECGETTVFGGDTYSDGVFTSPVVPEPLPPVPVPTLIATAVYTQTDGLVNASGISFALPLDVGVYWVFFTEPQPDLFYSVSPSCSEGVINVATREIDYVEVCVKGVGGAAVDPSEFSINIMRSL